MNQFWKNGELTPITHDAYGSVGSHWLGGEYESPFSDAKNNDLSQTLFGVRQSVLDFYAV